MFSAVQEDIISALIIDGYNLIGISHRDLGAARERLVNRLIQYSREKSHNITLVFDGWKGGGYESSVTSGGVRIVYSGLGEKADSVIKRIIASRKIQWIVISSDREIADFAWSNDAVPVGAGDFLDILGRTSQASGDKDAGESDEDDGYPAKNRKGSAYRPSRKEKAIRRALDKL